MRYSINRSEIIELLSLDNYLIYVDDNEKSNCVHKLGKYTKAFDKMF